MKTSKITTILLCIMAIILMSSCTNNNGKKENMPPKYIFLFIGDGMSYNNVALAESYLSYKSGKLGGEQLLFTTFPEFGSATSHSANRRVTDSSASGTAISTGSKTNNAMLGVDPEGNKLRSMSYDLHDMGYNVGIISSVPVNHATPSAFYAHNIRRGNGYEICQEIPSSGFEFFASSGFLQFKGKNGDLQPIDTYLEENGYLICESKSTKRYKSPLILTAKGAVVGKKIADKIECVLTEISDMMTEEERLLFYRCLASVSDGLETVAQRNGKKES